MLNELAYISVFTCEFNENMANYNLIVVGVVTVGYFAARRRWLFCVNRNTNSEIIDQMKNAD